MSAPSTSPMSLPFEERIALMLERLVAELRGLPRTPGNGLAELGSPEAHIQHATLNRPSDEAAGTMTAINTIETAPAMAKPKAHKPSVLMTPEEFAEILQVDLRTLRRWRHEGHVPQPIEIGGALRWRRVDIERWLEQKAT